MPYLSDLKLEVQNAPLRDINATYKAKFLLLIAITERMRDRLALVTGGIMTYDPNATPEYSHADYVRMPATDWDTITSSAQSSLDEVS